MKSEYQKHAEFYDFVHEHQAPLRGFLRMLGVNQDSVDDLAQETFMIAFRELDRFDRARDFGKWLRGIALNEVRNESRKSARRGRILNDEVTQHLMAVLESDQAAKHFEEGEFRALRDCIASLPENCRLLITGRYFDEWNSTILADKFEMSATAVRLTLMRIRRQLKICIEERLPNA
ncbi:sigma-70 family RNA polymerase sigma factor [Verrucomicrobiales bacterium]|nr:sigma-70 family RNA polymerase sigma factor [Verrucomicrobiales bacterium]